MKSFARKVAATAEQKFVERRAYLSGMARFEKLKKDTGYSVSKSDQKIIHEYAKEVFGSLRYKPWLLFYTAYRGEFHEGWIPSNFFKKIMQTENTQYTAVGRARTLSRRIFESDAFPDIAYYVKGIWMDVEGQPLMPADVKDLIFSKGNVAFLKAEESSKGRGVRSISSDGFDPGTFSSRYSHVVQRAIQQHPLLEELSPGCVATIRIITTVRFAEPAKTCAIYLRMNFDGGDVVSSSKGSSFKIGIEKENSTLQPTAIDYDWVRHETHPVKGIPFSEFSIPDLEQAQRFCERLHERVRQFALIGWDISVTADNRIEIMEWNTVDPAITFPEAALGPNFRHMEWEKLRLGR